MTSYDVQSIEGFEFDTGVQKCMWGVLVYVQDTCGWKLVRTMSSQICTKRQPKCVIRYMYSLKKIEMVHLSHFILCLLCCMAYFLQFQFLSYLTHLICFWYFAHSKTTPITGHRPSYLMKYNLPFNKSDVLNAIYLMNVFDLNGELWSKSKMICLT